MGAAYERALILYEQKRYNLARKEFLRDLAENPNIALTHAMVCSCLVAQSHFKAARQQGERAVELDPSLAFAHYALAWVFYKDLTFSCRSRVSFAIDQPAIRRKCLALADTAVREAIRLAPSNVDYLALLAWIRYELADHEGAMQAAQHGLAIDSRSNDCLQVQAYVLHTRGKVGAAKLISGAALSAYPEDAQAHLAHGRSLRLGGDWRGALEHFREAMRLDPNSPAARHALIVGICAGNPVGRLWLAILRPSEFGRSVQSVRAILVVGALLALPFLPAFLPIQLRSKAATAMVKTSLALMAALPVFILLTAPMWCPLTLQFDREGRQLLTIEERIRSSLCLIFVTSMLLWLMRRRLLPPSLDLQTLSRVLTSFCWVCLLGLSILRLVAPLRNRQHSREAGR